MRATVLFALAMASALTGIAHVADSPEDSWDRIRRTGVVRVGYAPERPFAFRTPDGRVTGEAPEIARIIFRRLDIRKVEWVQVEFHALIPRLLEGRFDMIAAGMFVTPERTRMVAFSHPTFVARPALLVRSGAPARWCGFSSFRTDSSAPLAVLEGSVEESAALHFGIPQRRLLAVPDVTNGILAVRRELAGAFALSYLSLRAASVAGTDLRIVSPTCDPPGPAGGTGAFVFRPSDRELRDAFDRELRRFLGTHAHRALAAQFGFTDADLAPVQAKQ